jgi:hypothetical protein
MFAGVAVAIAYALAGFAAETGGMAWFAKVLIIFLAIA